MIFFGWGRRSITAELTPGEVLVLAYRYVHVLWLFRFSWPQGYSLATATEAGWATRPLADEEVARIETASLPGLHWWWRYGLLIAVAGTALTVVVTSMFPA